MAMTVDARPSAASTSSSRWRAACRATPSRRSTRDEIRDTPQTIVVIPQQVFQEQSATSLRDVLRNTPGITMSIGEGASGTRQLRRQRPDPRLQRAQRHLHRRRPRSGRGHPRHVQRRSRSKSPRARRRSPAAAARPAARSTWSPRRRTSRIRRACRLTGRQRRSQARHLRRQPPADRLGRVPPQRRCGRTPAIPGRDVAEEQELGLCAVARLRHRQADAGHGVVLAHCSRTTCRTSGIPTLLPDVADRAGMTVNDLDFSNFYGIASRDYENTTSDVVTGTSTTSSTRRSACAT